MTSLINASNSAGVIITSDTSGNLAIQSGGNTVATITATGANAGIQVASWAAPAFSYYQNGSTTSLPNVSFTKITFDASDFDTTGGMFTSSRFTPTIAGYYQISGAILTSATSGQYFSDIYKNGTAFKRGSMVAGGTSGCQSNVSALVYCNGSSDYIELYAYQNSGSTQTTATGTSFTYLQGVFVRSA